MTSRETQETLRQLNTKQNQENRTMRGVQITNQHLLKIETFMIFCSNTLDD